MTTLARIAFVFGYVLFSIEARAQSNMIFNGDFETVNQPGCNSNIANSALGTYVTGLTGFGAANEIDVYTNPPCYGLPSYHGTTKIALNTQHAGNQDAFAFLLYSPVVGGTTYTIRCAAHPDFTDTPSVGSVQIGISDDQHSFGTQVVAFSLAPMLVWNSYSGTFVAPTDAQFVTVRSGPTEGWSHVDDFVLIAISSTAFCAGDGSGGACPCGNVSQAGDNTGCKNSLDLGGRLRSSGSASLSTDSLTILGDQMPNASSLYFQGTTQTAGGTGSTFGDGLRCVSGSIIRLGTAINAAGGSQYPQTGDPSVSVRGQVTSPGVRYYQVWYRNAAAFCTPSTFNLTNGIQVTWGA